MTNVLALRASDDELSLHDRVIGALPNQTPAWLVDGALIDHDWRIATDDPRQKSDAVRTVSHAVAIAPGTLLTAPAHEHDLITSKLMAYWLLEPPRNLAAATVAQRVRGVQWLMRWRGDAGFYRMSDLDSEQTFSAWAESLRYGLPEQVDWDRRVSDYVEAVGGGRVTIPTRTGFNVPVAADHAAVAEALGLPWLEVLPDRCYAAMLDLFAKHGLLDPHFEAKRTHLRGVLDRPRRALAREALALTLAVWGDLWGLRDRLWHDPIGIDPFARRSAWERAGDFAADANRRTRTAPEEQVCFLVDRALRWVFEYAPALLDAAERIEALGIRRTKKHLGKEERQAIAAILGSVRLDGPGAPTRLRQEALHHSDGEDGVSLFRAGYGLLPTACAIVIATFTARRREEIASLQEGCIEWDADGEPWMLTWIEKTLRDLDRIPVPVSVVRAVEILERLSATARRVNGLGWLFDFKMPVLKVSSRLNLGVAIKQFADFVEVPPTPDGTPWIFAPHQFRRFFAVVYYHRFRFASLTALSDFFKHYDPEMTRRYINESTQGSLARVREAADATALQVREAKAANSPADAVAAMERKLAEMRVAERAMRTRAKDFEDGRIEAEFERMWAVASSEEAMGGFKGEALKVDLEHLVLAARRQAELAPSDTLTETAAFNGLLLDFVRTRFFEPHPQGHSYCGCGHTDDDLALAACLRRRAEADVTGQPRATGPDLAFADALTCSGCAHNIQMPENRRWWEQRLRVHLNQSQAPASEHLGAVSRRMADACAGHIVRCFEEARPMSVTLGGDRHE